jgi:arsenite-transporting ATPase
MESEGCGFCRARKKAQQKYMTEIKEKFGHLAIANIPLQDNPVMGIDVLDRLKDCIFV